MGGGDSWLKVISLQAITGRNVTRSLKKTEEQEQEDRHEKQRKTRTTSIQGGGVPRGGGGSVEWTVATGGV